MGKYKETEKHPNHLGLIINCQNEENEWLDKHGLSKKAYLELCWIEEIQLRKAKILIDELKIIDSFLGRLKLTKQKHITICEQALNGELFTKEDMICLSDHFRLRFDDWDSRDAINYWIHNVRSK